MNDLPKDVQDFITKHIVSVEQMEVLVRLYEGRDRDWSPAELNREIQGQESSIARWLEVLVALKLATNTEGRYRFSPSSDEIAGQTGALVAIYKVRWVRVIEFIFSKPNEKLMSFARAFEFKKRP